MGHEDIDRIAALIKRVAADRTVLMVEHNLSVVENLCHRITVLTRGRVLAEGDYATVSNNPEVREAYHRGRAMLDARTPLLAVEDLQAWYGESHILHGVIFDVQPGRGGDAARPQRRRQDHDAEVDHGHRRPARRLGALRGPRTDRLRLQRDRARRHRASVRRSAASSRASPSRKICCCRRRCKPGGLSLDGIFELFPNLKERLGSSQGTKLSGGEQQMLAIARILRTGARLLLLDEPTEGLAPVIIQQIGKTIRTLKQQGFTILLVEQNFRFASTVADRYYVMEHGRVVESFANAELERQSRQAARVSRSLNECAGSRRV